jgi:MFS family permease
MLIAGRVLGGLGGTGLYVGFFTVVDETTTLQGRPRYLRAAAITWGLGTVLGPLVGGLLADSAATWR